MTMTEYYRTAEESMMSDNDLIHHLQEKIVGLTAHTDQVERMATNGVEVVTQLTARLANADEVLGNVRVELYAARERHQRDITTIGEALLEKAENHGWCGEFDTFVADLNGDLRYELPTRENEFTVTFTVTINVTAVGESAAREEAESAMQNASYNCNSDFDWSFDGVEEN